jgi:hypothetical protein
MSIPAFAILPKIAEVDVALRRFAYPGVAHARSVKRVGPAELAPTRIHLCLPLTKVRSS